MFVAAAITAYQTAQQAGSVVSSLTHSGQDGARQTRVDWTASMAQQGSITAARIVLAGPDNVSSNEAPMWRAAASKIPGNLLADAFSLGPWWPKGLPDFYTDVNGATHMRIVAEVSAAMGVSSAAPAPLAVSSSSSSGSSGTPNMAPVGSGGSTSGAQTLSPMVTTANAPTRSSSSALVVFLIVLLAIGALFFVLRR